MNNKLIRFILIIFIFPCVLLFSACGGSDETVYVKEIISNGKGSYTVKYSNGTTSEIKDLDTNVEYTIDDLKEEWLLTKKDGENFSDYLVKNTHLVISYDIEVEELKLAWQDDFNSGKTTKTFSEFLASFAYIGDGFSLTQSINKVLLNSVSIVSSFTYTTVFNPWTGTGGEEKTVQSAGSGVIYSLDKTNKVSYIITNYHVVFDEDYSNSISSDIRICVYGSENFKDDSSFYVSAEFVGGSAFYDIAVLKITAGSKNSDRFFNSNISAAKTKNSDEIYVGEQVFAIGNAQGYGISAVNGIISVDSEKIKLDKLTTSREIRISAAVNPGNSGGGLFDSKGNLIGIVNAKLVDESIEGISYAIPGNVALAVAENVIKNCDNSSNVSPKFVRVGISVGIKDSYAKIDETTKIVNVVETVYINEVSSGSLASSTNLAKDDIINSIKIKRTETSEYEEFNITRSHIYTDAILKCFVGGCVEFNVTHSNNTTETIAITFTENCLEVVA